MIKPKNIRIFFKGQARKTYLKIKNKKDKQSKIIYSALQRIIKNLKTNPQYGQPLSKKLIPKEFKKLNIQNLYRVELPNFWRLLYTIEGNRIEIFVFILHVSNHKNYNKLMKYTN